MGKKGAPSPPTAQPTPPTAPRRQTQAKSAKPRPQPGTGQGRPARRRTAAGEAARGHAPRVACADAPQVEAFSANPRPRSLKRARDGPPAGAQPPAKRTADMRRGSRALTPPGRGRSAPNPGDSLERAKDGPPVGATPPTKRPADTRRGSRALTPPGRGRSAPNQVESRPISRVLSWAVIPLGAASPRPSSNLPGSTAGHSIAPLFGLAPGGVYPATPVARSAVRSYRTLSPLPGPCGP